ASAPHAHLRSSPTRRSSDLLASFSASAAAFDLPGAALFGEVTPTSWDSALRLLAQAVPQDSPSIVVIDELPYMIAQDPHLEGRLDRKSTRLNSSHVKISYAV